MAPPPDITAATACSGRPLLGSVLVRRSASRSNDLRACWRSGEARKVALEAVCRAQARAGRAHEAGCGTMARRMQSSCRESGGAAARRQGGRAHVLQDRQAEVAQPVQLVHVGEGLKVAQRGDGRRQLLRENRVWIPGRRGAGRKGLQGRQRVWAWGSARKCEACAQACSSSVLHSRARGGLQGAACKGRPAEIQRCNADLEDAVAQSIHQAVHRQRLAAVPRLLHDGARAHIEHLRRSGSSSGGEEQPRHASCCSQGCRTAGRQPAPAAAGSAAQW